MPRTPRRSASSPRIAPSSSPESVRQPSASGIATAQRSASGSLAMINSAPVSVALVTARSRAPGSSGFGNDTVGKDGSGCSCSATTAAGGKPVSSQACLTIAPPTPCIGV